MGGTFSSSPTPSKHPKPRAPGTVFDLMELKLSQRNWKDRMLFKHALKGFCGLGIVSSLYMNSMMRRHLMIYETLIYTSLGISALTCGANFGLQSWLIQWPLLEGKLRCAPCAITRGSVVQAFSLTVFPGVLAFCAAGIVAEKYGAINIPDLHFPPRKEFRDFWKRVSPPILRKSMYMAAFHALLGAVITYKQFRISRELYTSITPEEMSELWKQTVAGGRIS